MVLADPALLNHWAWSHRWRDPLSSREQAKCVLELTPADNDPGRALALRSLAWHARWNGNFTRAEALCDAAQQGLEQRDNKDPLADIHAIRALIHCRRGEIRASLNAVLSGEALLTPQSAMSSRVDLLVIHANLLRHEGRIHESFDLLKSGLAYARGAEMVFLRHAISRDLLAELEYGKTQEAAQIALSAARRFENMLVLPYILRTLAACEIYFGRDARADAYLSEGLEVAAEHSDPKAMCQLTAMQVERMISKGQIGLAEKLLQTLRVLLGRHDLDPDQIASCEAVLSLLDHPRG